MQAWCVICLVLFVALIKLKLAQIFGRDIISAFICKEVFVSVCHFCRERFGNKIDRMIHSVDT